MKTTAQGPFRDAPIPFHDTPLPDGLTVFRVGSSVRIDKETRLARKPISPSSQVV